MAQQQLGESDEQVECQQSVRFPSSKVPHSAICSALVGLFMAVFSFRVFKVILPAAEHFADFVEFLGDLLALFVGNQFSFPSCGDEKPERIEYENAFRDLCDLLLLVGKISCVA